MLVRICFLAALLTGSSAIIALAQAEPVTEMIGSEERFDELVQIVQSADFSSALGDIDAASTFYVVKLSTIQGAEAAKLQTALDASEGVTKLQAALADNNAANAALAKEDLIVDQVVWMTSATENEVTLFASRCQVVDHLTQCGEDPLAPAHLVCTRGNHMEYASLLIDDLKKAAADARLSDGLFYD